MSLAPARGGAAFEIPFRSELAALVAVGLLGLLGYIVFPDDLAFLTRLISITLLVLSLDLVTGYCGVATLGQAALFGFAAYAAGNACVAGLANPFLLIVVGMLAGTAAGILSGLLVARFRGLQQLVLSIAFGQLVAALANKLTSWTGGSDGLSGIAPAPVFGRYDFDLYGHTAYWLSVGALAIVMAALAAFVRSPFALACQAIRDDDLRAQMIGMAVYPRLVAMYAVSGAVAGVGGALSAITTGVVGLDSVSFERSAEALVMLVLGGAGHLWGALMGAILFQVFEHYVTTSNPYSWLAIVGLLLIAIVIFAPGGLVRGLDLARRRRMRRRA
jgi:branched-chain amino acid transport system permease protein